MMETVTVMEQPIHQEPTLTAEELVVMAKTRRYHRGERGLESLEKQYITSERMQRLIAKLNTFYDIQGFKAPNFVPVHLSGRLKTSSGLHYYNKIVLEKSVTVTTKYKRDLLWHEIMHSVIHDNYHVLYNEYALLKKQIPSCNSFEKTVFRLGINDGSHGSQNYKLLCECGMWIKTVNRKESWHCPRCNVLLVSKSEYNKLKKIAILKSTIKPTDINHYKPWKSNEKIA